MDNILRKRINVKRDNVAPYKSVTENGYIFRGREKSCPQEIASGSRPKQRHQISRDNAPPNCYQSAVSASVAEAVQESGANLVDMEIIDGECEIDISNIDVYINLLMADNGITIGDNLGLITYVRERRTTSCLHKDAYVVVCRRAFCFQDEQLEWIFWCKKCHKNSVVPSLSSKLHVTYEDYDAATCLHCQTVSVIMKEYDNIHGIIPTPDLSLTDVTDFDHEYSLAENASICQAYMTVCNSSEGQHAVAVCFPPYNGGVIIIKNGQLFCITCEKTSCGHMVFLSSCSTSNSELEVVNTMLSYIQTPDNFNSSRKRSECKSKKKIPFEPCTEVVQSLQMLDTISNNCSLGPDIETVCEVCELPLLEINDNMAEVLAVTVTKVLKVRVYHKLCGGCGAIVHYDGSSDGVLNMSNYLVGHDILREYMHSFLHGKRSMHTFYQVLCDMHVDRGNVDIRKIFSYDNFRLAWLSFLKLLDIKLDEGFICPECSKHGNQPNLIICDGTSLSFQRRMWHWNIADNKPSKQIRSRLRFQDRVFIPQVDLRKLLKRFAGSSDRSKGLKALTEDEKEDMFQLLNGCNIELHDFVVLIAANRLVAPEYSRKFLLSLASTSPVCAYIPCNEDVISLLSRIIEREDLRCDPVSWSHLQQLVPVVFDILVKCESHIIPVELSKLLNVLLNKTRATFLPCEEEENEELLHDKSTDLSSFFPSLPIMRNRGSYDIDKQQHASADMICGKNYRGHPTLLPGIFTVYCCHNICYGFKVMLTNESPNVPFTLMKTRFLKAPTTVVYDFSCGLHKYCLNRDPLFFQHTTFLVDRLHWDNHTDCSSAYNLNEYPHFVHLNSQIAEQANAGLKRIKDQLSYMTAENFMSHCAFYLYNKNLIRRRSIENFTGVNS